jgi:tetratricopeptide (TPR) repeat protein
MIDLSDKNINLNVRPDEERGVRGASEAYEALGRQANEFRKVKDYAGERRSLLQMLDLAENGGERSVAQYAIGGSFYSEKNFAQARAWYQKVLVEKEGYVFLYRNALSSIATSYGEERDYDAAIEAARALLQDPKSRLDEWVTAWMVANSAYNNLHQYDRCIEVLEEALAEKSLSKDQRAMFEQSLASARRMYANQQQNGRR